MDIRAHKLSKDDNNLAVLYNHILIGEEVYEYLREFQHEHHKHIDHKNNIIWLMKEIEQAVLTAPDWVRGREQLLDLLELGDELKQYYDQVYKNKTLQDSIRQFRQKHQIFLGITKQLLRLFSD